VVTSHHVPYMSPTIWLPWRRSLPSNGALNILQLWASGGRTREPILIKFDTHQHVRTRTTATWLNIKIFKIQNGGRPPCWKIFEMSWCGCYGNGRCLATAHWTFCSHERLEAERVNQFWWNLVHNSKLGPQWQSRDQILKFLKFKMADGRHVRKY